MIITEIFRNNRNNYDTCKTGNQISRRRIGRIMKQERLVSNYITTQFKSQKDTCNELKMENIFNRQFQGGEYRDVVISDLTYVRVKYTGFIYVYLLTFLTRKS